MSAHVPLSATSTLQSLPTFTTSVVWSFCRRLYIHTHLTTLFPGLPRWASTRKVKPIWILLKQETESGSGVSWAICKSAPHSRQITTSAPHHSIFYRPVALPATQPTASKHWRHCRQLYNQQNSFSHARKANAAIHTLCRNTCILMTLVTANELDFLVCTSQLVKSTFKISA